MRFPIDVILMCIRWSGAYGLSYRQVREMTQAQGVLVEHFLINRWAIRFLSALENIFSNYKRPVGVSWPINENLHKRSK